jgi:putative Mg2+ transporter-C (MgtC) family protein
MTGKILDLPAFDGPALVTTLVCVGAAFVLGGLIGIERQVRQRNAGLRTMVLVSVGSAAFAHLGLRILGAEGEIRIIAYVVSGIGFLGAGVIMKEGLHVRGLNTAATLWGAAAVGAFAGAGFLAESVGVTILVLAGNTLLRPLVNWIDRLPVVSGATEALYRIHVICAPEQVSAVRDLLHDELERLHYPIRDIDVLSENEDSVELAATLVPTSADERDLDAIVAHLAVHAEVGSATWTASTTL